MNAFKAIQDKLEQFIRKYYTNALIKGAILFFSLGLLYFIFTLLIEHFLWLSTTARTLLFWIFIAVEFGLLLKFILLPLAKLVKLQKGIDYEDASTLIGNHFPEVNDKLLNVLQLKSTGHESELLLASIDQKAEELSPIPFKNAINFKKNAKYLKYALIPIAIVAFSKLSGHFNWFSDSYERVVNYKTAYQPPAPFQFYVLNDDLTVTEDTPFTLVVKTEGETIPENAQIVFNNESYYLKQVAPGEFEFLFEQPKNNISFQLQANDVNSKPYTLNVLHAPTLLSFDMVLNYPNYTNKKDEVLRSTGNAIVPQGTLVTWKLNTTATTKVNFYAKDTTAFKATEADKFSITKQIYNTLQYNISTSNAYLQDYENLGFTIKSIADAHPELKIEAKTDTIDNQTLYFKGQVSDDYGLSKLQLVYYPTDDNSQMKVEPITVSKSNFDEFFKTFPGNLPITEGVSYELFFQVFDNDVLGNYKNVKSNVYTYRKRTLEEEENKKLEEQNETIKDLDKTLKKFDEQEKELEQFSKTQKEKNDLNFNDKKKLDNFIKRQQQQEQMMKEFNKDIKENLEEFQKENKEKDTFKEDLKERLKQNEEQLKKDEELLKELEKYREKLSKEELSEKLEKLAKQTKNQKRSLEQVLELTKRYYVSKKLETLSKDLEELAKEQEELSKKDGNENTKEKQEELNKKFDDYTKQLDDLQKENKNLKEPMDIPQNKMKEDDIKEDQQGASDELQEEQQAPTESQKQDAKAKAKKKQQSAAMKMKQAAQAMMMSMEMSDEEALQEDMEMLRQILDNLVLFSFDEEDLMNKFKSIEVNHNAYANYLKKQQDLRIHFEHIDDSLFALSLRQPKISEKVNKDISEVYFYTDKAMEELAENNLYKGVSSQQYVLTNANNLADFLSQTLDNMQNSKPSMGAGQGESGAPLPDIIMSQAQLAKMMGEGMKKGEKGEKGEKGKDGKKGENGESGENGQSGKNGKGGENGEGGEGGKGGKDGKDGQDGFSEDQNGELYKIYQQQQQLREALEDRMEKDGTRDLKDSRKILDDMEEIELDLINKGFTNETLSKMMDLQHQLLKLKNATFQQGEEEKRESKTNAQQFNNTTNNKVPNAKEYFNSKEILNKQALPLQLLYKQKAQHYFKTTND